MAHTKKTLKTSAFQGFSFSVFLCLFVSVSVSYAFMCNRAQSLVNAGLKAVFMYDTEKARKKALFEIGVVKVSYFLSYNVKSMSHAISLKNSVDFFRRPFFYFVQMGVYIHNHCGISMSEQFSRFFGAYIAII